MIPAGWGALGFTSGRRTYRGNKLVGGVSNSDHLQGHAADFTAPLSVLQARFPGHRILDEGDHRHVSGLSDVPYYGNQGVAGLVNGVDTTAPKGQPMIRPRKPVIAGELPNYAAMSQPMGGMDPLAALPDAPPMPLQAPQAPAQPLYAQPAPPPAPKGRKLNLGAIAGILGDALSAMGGQRGVYAPFMMQQRENEAEDNRFQQRLAAQTERDRAEALAAARKPYRFQNNSGDVVEVDPATGDQRVLYMDPVGKTDYARITDPTTGEISITPMGQGSRPTAAHIEALRANPDRAAEFDAKFGRGASAYVLGGH